MHYTDEIGYLGICRCVERTMWPDNPSRIWGLTEAAHTHDSIPHKNPSHTLAFLSGARTTNAFLLQCLRLC